MIEAQSFQMKRNEALLDGKVYVEVKGMKELQTTMRATLN